MPTPVLSVAQMRAWEAASWAAGLKPETVIGQVGRRTGDWLLARSDPDDALVFLVGRGNNGEDARAAARWVGWRRRQRSVPVADPAADAARVAEALAEAARQAPRVWVVDGLFGIGLNRPFNPAWRDLVDALNRQTDRPSFETVAVDVPSGLVDDAGRSAGAVVQATHTLTVGAPKRGLVGLPAAGRVHVLGDVGLLAAGWPAAALPSTPPNPALLWRIADDLRDLPPRRPVAAHKGSQGHLLLVAGSLGYHGAAVLAARAALRAGPGLVTVACDPAVYGPIATRLAQPMVHPWSEAFAPPASVSAVVVGPGLASPTLPPRMKDWVRSLWEEFPGPVLADASALDWLPGPSGPDGPDGPDGSRGPRILTPHPGEAARLLGRTVREVQADRVAAARELQRRLGATVVLKGHHTLVADAASVCVNPTGNPGLAQGGTGDVLAGFVGGWLARRRPVPEALAYGVWEHGLAADRLGDRGPWTTEDLVAELR